MYNAIISTQVKDENDYLDEWVRYHLGIGFEHIVIYDNESVIPVKNLWGKKVTVIRESRAFEGSAEDNCHNDTIRNFDAYWVARIDIDEFIVLKKHKEIGELLEPYKEYGGLGINWRIFGTSGHIKKPAGNVRDNYVWRVPDNCGWIINGGSFQLKTIINRQYCVQIHHPHWCHSLRPLVNEDFVPYPDAWTDSTRQLAVIHHYVTKSVEEWQAKYYLWRHKYGLRTMNELADIEKNCTVYDDLLKNKEMENQKGWNWASHQPMIKGVLELFKPKYILELGIGENSTPIFNDYHEKYYFGIENNKEWIEYMQKRFPSLSFILHDLDKEKQSIVEYYKSLTISPDQKPKLLFVDNYESCRMLAINALRDKFDLIIFHDCEPDPGVIVNHYQMINSEGFNVYFLKTSANWTGLMVKIGSGIDTGFNNLLTAVNPFIEQFYKDHPDMECMYLEDHYEGFTC